MFVARQQTGLPATRTSPLPMVPTVSASPSEPPVPPALRRELFPREPRHAALLRLLLAQDGSATRLCEALSGRKITVVLQHQVRTQDVPEVVKRELGGDEWLERATTLHAWGTVLLDNISYTRLDRLPDWFLAKLDQGDTPIGYMLDQLFLQRDDLPLDTAIAERLWPLVGLPDEGAAKLYRVAMPQGPLMLVMETFRAGWTQVQPPATAP